MSILRLSVSLAFAACSSLAHAQAVEVVRIGHVAPLSGAQAHYGKDNENGARMAIEDLNARNLVIGGRKIRFELVPEDDAADPKQGTAAAQKLCDAKVNGIVGHLNSGTTIPAADIYNKCGIPHITPSATNPKLTTLGYKTTFRLLANDNHLGAALARHAVHKLGLKTVAIIDDRTAYGTGIAQVFRATAQQLGLQVVSEQSTTDKAVDFSAILTAIKGRKPDGVFFGGMDPQAGPMLRQMQRLGLGKAAYFGGDGLCTIDLANRAAGAKTLENVVCAVGGGAWDRQPAGREWKKRYDAKFPGQFQVYAAYCYDSVMVLADAMKRAESTDPKVYGSKIPETNYTGISGQIQFDANGDLRNPAVTLYVYRGGVREALQ